MRTLFHSICFCLVLLCLTFSGWLHSAERVRVKANKVNLRSAPANSAEVVYQAAAGEILESSGNRQGEWLAVFAPEQADLWVYDEFVSGGIVEVSKLQVRAGPGINYTVLGRLDKGDSVIARGLEGEWRKIAPPAGYVLWVSSGYTDPVVDHVKPVAAEDSSVIKSASAATEGKSTAAASESKPSLPARTVSKPLTEVVRRPAGRAISHTMLDASRFVTDAVQGQAVELGGTLRPSGLVWRVPGRYKLVSYDKWDRAVTVCYISSEDDYLVSIQGRNVLMTGAQYLIRGVRHPVLVPERVILSE